VVVPRAVQGELAHQLREPGFHLLELQELDEGKEE
jgi:hypothetical protein